MLRTTHFPSNLPAHTYMLEDLNATMEPQPRALFHDFPSSFYVLEFRARRSTEFQHQPNTHTTRDINDIWFPFCKLHTAALCNCWLRNFGGRLNFLESSIGKISKLEEQSWHFWRFSKFFHPRRKWKNHFDKIRVLNSSPKKRSGNQTICPLRQSNFPNFVLCSTII